MRLNTLKPGRGARTSRKRLGRGIGSGLGKTSGKGHKGQHARAAVGSHSLPLGAPVEIDFIVEVEDTAPAQPNALR